MTERQKARGRLLLLTLVGFICPPLAGARSAPVWVLYIVFVVLYSLWALRLARNFSEDRRLGYLLSLTDTAILLPLLVWTSSAAMQALLLMVCVGGLAVTYWVDRMRVAYAGSTPAESGSARTRLLSLSTRPDSDDTEVPLERALRMRLRMFETSRSRFALVILRIVRFEEINAYYGEETADRLLGAISRRGLRLLGADAQHFILPRGRVAFVFATTGEQTRFNVPGQSAIGQIDPYDVESMAMALARKTCEHLVDGHRVECVVGWAAAPSDGLSADDLMYAAESGAQSTAAFRRVAGSRVPVPEKTRVAAG